MAADVVPAIGVTSSPLSTATAAVIGECLRVRLASIAVRGGCFVARPPRQVSCPSLERLVRHADHRPQADGEADERADDDSPRAGVQPAVDEIADGGEQADRNDELDSDAGHAVPAGERLVLDAAFFAAVVRSLVG